MGTDRIRSIIAWIVVIAVMVVFTWTFAKTVTAHPDSAACNQRCIDRVKAHKRAEIQRKHRVAWHRVADPYWGIFNAIASCESHGQWHIRGYFSGGIQFLDSSWHHVGGTGRAADHSKLEQIYRGVLLMRRQGWGAWPVCRAAAGV